MPGKVVPMIHVPDVRATAEWYRSIGFELNVTNEDHDGGLNFAMLSLGSTEVMFSAGGKPSDAFRREVDLYVYTDDAEEARRRMEGKAEVVQELNDTFYGTREFIVRDPNRFWITFGQPISTPGE